MTKDAYVDEFNEWLKEFESGPASKEVKSTYDRIRNNHIRKKKIEKLRDLVRRRKNEH